MATLHFADPARPVTRGIRWRHRFSLLALVACVALIAWGGLVTSIDAGLAVPDWPTSFGSYDPLATGFQDPTHPDARWWDRLPILAEHGHRLLGALMGLLTVVLALWTWRADPRSWMRRLGFAALGLVVLQGILGGLRVIWVSLDLAVVHALTAQLFFSLFVALTLFTAPGWLRAESVPAATPEVRRLGRLALATVAALYVQILLGALLRHPGAGIHGGFASVHIAGAAVVTVLVLITFNQIRRHFTAYRLLNRTGWFMLGAVVAQLMLGFAAFLVLVLETRMAQRSMVQVALNSAHLVVGALLTAATVCLMLLAFRRPAGGASHVQDPVTAPQPLQPVGS